MENDPLVLEIFLVAFSLSLALCAAWFVIQATVKTAWVLMALWSLVGRLAGRRNEDFD